MAFLNIVYDHLWQGDGLAQSWHLLNDMPNVLHGNLIPYAMQRLVFLVVIAAAATVQKYRHSGARKVAEPVHAMSQDWR